MFDLEQAIMEWRKRMLAAGIKSPAPLEELEIHLREEIEQLTNHGLSAQTAFDSGIQKIGRADELKTEFKKASGSNKWLSRNEAALALRILGLFWLILCVSSIFVLDQASLQEIQKPNFSQISWIFPCFKLLMEFIYLLGIVASILLLKGDLRERRFLRLLSGIFVTGGIAAMAGGHASNLTFPFTIFGFASLWLLRPPQKTKLANQ